MPTEIFSPEIDYETRVLNASTSIYRTISPQASNSVSLSPTSAGNVVEFVIPASVFNFSKSRLNFTLSSVASANISSWINANPLTMINRIVIYDVATNSSWLDCSSFQNYASMTSSIGTPIDSFLTKGYATGLPATSAANASLYPQEDMSKCNDATKNYTSNMAGTVQDMALENPYLGRREYFISALNTAVYLDFSIPFSAFKNTVMALDKQLYNASNTIIQIYFNSTDTFGFGSDAVNAITNPVSLSTTTISNLNVSLCNEGNLLIVGQVIETVMKRGLSLPICYPTCTRQLITGPLYAYQLQLTRGYAQRILAILTSFFSTANIASTLTHARGNVSTYNTYINNVALLAPGGFNCEKGTDYTIANKHYLDKSVIQTQGEYAKTAWVHCDSFIGSRSLTELDQTVIAGLDVSNQSSTWQITANGSSNANYIWATVILGQKVLTLSNSGSVVV